MTYIDFIEQIHGSTSRDYLQRVVEYDKAELAAVAKEFGYDYFDGARKYGYGGYHYDGRWRSFARSIVDHYALGPGSRILDVGCAKGFLLHDLLLELPSAEVAGVDVSAYAIEHAMEDVRGRLTCASAAALPFQENSFDLVLSVNTLHNLRLPDLAAALREVERVSRGSSYLVLDGYRSEAEKVNLMYWQLTCECFFTPDEWQWLFDTVGYSGDFACIYYS